jgi:hypothetical protein
MRMTLKAIGFVASLATLTVMLAACGPDDRYDNPAADADRGVGAGVGAGTTTTVPRALPNPAP